MQEIGLQMEQKPVNQRIKFLLDTFNMSARTFSELIGEKPSNTQNYVGTRNSMPGADYLEKILNHFENVSSIWLLTGKGEPFTSDAAESRGEYHTQSQNQKKNRGHIINHTGNGPATYTLEDCRREREVLQLTCDQQKEKIQMLQANIDDLRKALTIAVNNIS